MNRLFRARTVLLSATLFLLAGILPADSYLNVNEGPLDVTLVAETGFVKVLYHTIQLGADGDVFDYVKEGGQEVLFPFKRLSAELTVRDRHTLIFLYQPLEVVTQSRFDANRTIDGQVFPADGGVDITYSFPFYRVSYLFDFARAENLELAAGLSLQVRNASIRFESTDGDIIVVTQDLGPVPIIKVRAEYVFPNARIPGAFLGFEADGFYASSAFINGADYDFTGSIFDASLRAGFEPVPGVDLFANVRGLGGGGAGTRPPERRTFWTQSRDGFTDNFLTTLSVTLGARLR
jgi:hypothetical protein